MHPRGEAGSTSLSDGVRVLKTSRHIAAWALTAETSREHLTFVAGYCSGPRPVGTRPSLALQHSARPTDLTAGAPGRVVSSMWYDHCRHRSLPHALLCKLLITISPLVHSNRHGLR